MAPQDSIHSVMERLDPLLDDFDDIARHAVTFYRGYRSDVLVEHSPRSAANCTYDHMVAACDKRFHARADIRPFEVRGLKLWLLGEQHHTVIRWKKMDEDGRSRNYPTKQAENFDLQLPIPDLPPLPTRITVGYLLDPSGTSVLRTQIARPNGKRFVEWCAAIIPSHLRKAGDAKWEDVTMQSRFG